jgi:predicted dithiol-disulfide oxidoreductase (DUF899 family)
MATATTARELPRVVPHAEWLAAREELLRKEKEFTRLRDELSRKRRELPREKVEKPYVFEGPGAKETLADLFGDKSQLIVYHFMFGPGWEQGCPSCSFLSDHIDGSVVHLAARDVRLVVVSRAPVAQIEAFKKRMGWRFKWVSSYGNDFNRDYHVSFTKDEMAKGATYYNYSMQKFPSEEGPGTSVFYKDAAGNIFHTYSAYGRGLDMLIGPTTGWISRRKDATKMDWLIRWRGFATTTGTARGMLLTPSSRTCSPQSPVPPAARTTNIGELSTVPANIGASDDQEENTNRRDGVI